MSPAVGYRWILSTRWMKEGMSDMTSPLAYVVRGWKVFPCYSIVRGSCECSKGVACNSPGKHPRTQNGVKDATDNTELVKTWMERWPHANWAVACGTISGIVVIDIDPRKNGFASLEELETMRQEGPLPPTLQSNTGGSGRHLIYKHPGGIHIGNRNNWLSGIDVKSDGGYVILPEAEHISGGRYTWEDWEREIVPLPLDILQMLSAAANAGVGSSDLGDTDDILRGVPEGARDDTLFKACCRWRRQLGDGAKQAVVLLALQAAGACDPPFPEAEARKCVDSAWKQDHTDSTIDWAFTGGADVDDESLNLTDVGNAHRFVRRYGDIFRHVEAWGWMQWYEIGWRTGADSFALQKACKLSETILDEGRVQTDPRVQQRYAKWAKDSESVSRIRAAVELARVQHGMALNADDFDSCEHLLNCRNAMVNLKTGETRTIKQSDLVTKNTRVVYEPGYRLAAWEKFLQDATDGDTELIEYLQMAAGYTLTGSNAEECFFIISGPQASGKSTFLDALHAAVGKDKDGGYGTATPAETITYQRNKNVETELARLAGMRLVTVSEIRESASFDEALVKSITGGDQLRVRFLYKTAFVYRPQFKLWIATNYDPETRDDAIWRRLKKIAFKRSVPKGARSPELKRVLRDPELGGKAVLAWAVEGAMKWYAQGGLCEPDSVQMEVKTYHADQDRAWHFVLDCIAVVHGARVPLNDMYTTYLMWCRTTNEIPKRQPQFRKALEARGIVTVPDDRGRPVFADVAPRSMTVTTAGVQWT